MTWKWVKIAYAVGKVAADIAVKDADKKAILHVVEKELDKVLVEKPAPVTPRPLP